MNTFIKNLLIKIGLMKKKKNYTIIAMCIYPQTVNSVEVDRLLEQISVEVALEKAKADKDTRADAKLVARYNALRFQ